MKNILAISLAGFLLLACTKQEPAPDKTPPATTTVTYLKASRIASGALGYIALRTDGSVVYTTTSLGGWTTSNITGVVDVIEGGYMLKGDGTIWTLFDSIHHNTPQQVNNLTGIISVAHGGQHFLALRNDGTVWAWGTNRYGQLGDSTFTDRTYPVQVKGLSGVVSVAAGMAHSVALKNDGSVVGWGLNFSGELGSTPGVIDSVYAPIPITGLAGITSIAAGNSTTYAVKNDGSLLSCGNNATGQLGDGTTTNKNYPIPVSGLSGVTSVTATNGFAFALKNDSTAWGWGYNANGNLGDNYTSAPRLTPVKVYYLASIKFIRAGSFALERDGTAWAWGDNSIGQLGITCAQNTVVSPPQRIPQ